jgi:hypothetical protein
MTIRASWLLFLPLSGSALAAASHHCRRDEKAWFRCETKNGKFVSLCGAKDLKAEGAYVQYRYGRVGSVELEWPALKVKRSGKQGFRFSDVGTATVNETIFFVSGPYRYQIMLGLKFDRRTNRRVPGFSGVVVSRNNVQIARIPCKKFPGFGFDLALIELIKKREKRE